VDRNRPEFLTVKTLKIKIKLFDQYFEKKGGSLFLEKGVFVILNEMNNL